MELNEFIKSILGEKFELTRLHGDASYRIYYRAKSKDQSYIIMQMPDGISSPSEEITDIEKPDELPYISMTNFLLKRCLPVPRIYKTSKNCKFLAIEDLGDGLMFNYVFEKTKSEMEWWYKKSLDLLIDFQNKTKTQANDCIGYKRKFSKKLLMWELDHFYEYLILGRGESPPEDVRDKFKVFSEMLISEIEKMPYLLVHRDYQSRNLIVKNDVLYLIDFQDALMGPYVYDLVALLRDSYVFLDDDMLKNMLSYFIKGKNLDVKKTMNDFMLVTLHRKMKDAGRFVYIEKVKNNPNYLKFIPDTLGYIKTALNCLPEYQHIYDLIKPWVKEWNS